jgi:hypothetical protein
VPWKPPPEAYNGSPALRALVAGTELTRVHDIQFAPCAFKPTPADRYFGGGRFDATADDRYPYLYAAESDECAVSEALLRTLPDDHCGAFLLDWARLQGRCISWIRLTCDLELVTLVSGEDLAAVSQDTWLTTCDSKSYVFTRTWGHRIRKWAPSAQGFVWLSRREPTRHAYIFFGDRCPDDCFVEVQHPRHRPPDGNRLDHGPGHAYVRAILDRYNVTVFPVPPVP